MDRGLDLACAMLKVDIASMGKYVNIPSDFIFLDRTRYGLLRLFEQMEARISFRNPYE